VTVKPRKLKEGEKAYLTCESASSNPPAKVSWWRDGMSIPSHSNSSKDGMYGGKKTLTTLELDLTSELDNVVYTCQASNTAVKKSVHDAVTLQVACELVEEYHQVHIICVGVRGMERHIASRFLFTIQVVE
jgi:hypothetical protein